MKIKQIFQFTAAFAFLLFAPHRSWALARWECRGLTADKMVLAPYDDGSVTLAFNDGDAVEKTKYTHKGDVFFAIFKDVSKTKNASLSYLIDTITRNGYEMGDIPGKPAFAAKITCWWYPN